VGNSDAHTASSISCGFSWFEGKSAQDIRTSIEQGLTAPGGKMWDVQAYYQWIRYRLSKEGRQTHQTETTAVA
jgi:predicted solute-binding protein